MFETHSIGQTLSSLEYYLVIVKTMFIFVIAFCYFLVPIELNLVFNC